MSSSSKMNETVETRARGSDISHLVTEPVVSTHTCKKLKKAITQRILEVVSLKASVDIESDQLDKILTCPGTRLALFDGDTAKANKLVFRDGNSRMPLVSKSTGMSDQHYIPEVLRAIAFNKKLYRIAEELYGMGEGEDNQLSFTAGLEKICYKAPGTTAMPKHIDWCPFLESVNYPRRWQCVVTISIESDSPKPNGTLVLLDGFLEYVYFFGKLCHPRTGLIPFPDVAASWSRFFVLPSNFDSYYVPELIKYATLYRRFLRNPGKKRHDKATRKAFRRWHKEGLAAPSKGASLEWRLVQVEPGQAIFWDQRIPHYSSANKTDITRIACYYSIFPRQDVDKSTLKWVREQVEDLRFSYGREADRFPRTVRNPEELAYLRTHPEEEARIREILMKTARRRALLCF